MDSGGRIYLWNRKAEEMFGFSAEEAIGMELHGMIVPEKYRDKARDGKRLFFEAGTGPLVGKTIEALGLRKDGTEFPVELSILAMKIKETWHATGIIRDIMVREQAKKKLQDRLEELELFHKATIQRDLNIKDLRSRIKGLEGDK